ncbi:AAA family ATPase [Exiguobacterium artemiae]
MKDSQIYELSDLILSYNSSLFQNIQSHAILNYLGDMFTILHTNDIFNRNQSDAAKENDISEISLETMQKRNKNFSTFLNRIKNTNITFNNIVSIFETSFASTDFPESDIIHVKTRYTNALQKMKNMDSLNNSTNKDLIIGYSINVDKSLQDDFFPAYFTISSQKFLNFSWDLSTGENHFLNLCSKILQLRNEYERSGSDSKRLWLLIDEGNSSFHPEWQGRYIKTILDVASELLHDYSIQLFLTTHSPLVLSDIPHSNVAYVNSIESNNTVNANYKTFGQNLYNLFSEVFSTSKTYGILAAGVFERLNLDLITIKKSSRKDINFFNQANQPNLNSIENVVNIIGEKIIRYSFQDKISKLKDDGKTTRVLTTFDSFKSMNNSEKETFIQYVIDLQKNEENLE